MKKILKSFLTILIIFSFCGCSNEVASVDDSQTENNVEQVIHLWDEVNEISLDDVLSVSNAEHYEFTNKQEYGDYDSYIGNSDDDFTSSELNELLSKPSSVINTLNYDETIEDVEIFFRILRNSYAAYFYFGEEQFEEAKDSVIKSFEGKTEITTRELGNALHNSIMFCKDHHLYIESDTGVLYPPDSEYNYRYYYDYSHLFDKDDNGFYKQENGIKYYFSKCENNDNVFVDFTLLEDGRIVYSLVLFEMPSNVSLNDTLVLTDYDGNEIREDVTWTKACSYEDKTVSEPNTFLYDETLSVSVLRVMDNENKNTINKCFVNPAKDFKNSEYVIIDERSNNGGTDNFTQEWFKNYTGKDPKINALSFKRLSKLSGSNSNEFKVSQTNGVSVDNDNILFMLVDYMDGSSSEGIVRYFKMINNFVIIGSNTGGCQLTGNVKNVYLKNSGLEMHIPTTMTFYGDMTCYENVGFEPDIWCNPKVSYNALINYMAKIADIDEDKYLGLDVREADVTVFAYGHEESSGVKDKANFGYSGDAPLFDVHYGGERITDYTVSSDDTDVMVSNENGSLKVVSQTKGVHTFNIEYKGKTYIFTFARYN